MKLLIAKIAGPIVILGGVYLAGRDHGADAAKAKINERIESARKEEWTKYIDRDRVAGNAYAKALELVAASQSVKPHIIERIQNAPATECSGRPIGDDRVRLLNSAIASGWPRDSGAGSTARREAGRHAIAAVQSDE